MGSGEFEEGAPRSMAYFEAIRFVAHSPGWLVNLLWGSLCIVSAQIIPVAGQIVWMGYGVEVLESLLRGNQQRYPDFDINRLVEYLQRGAWPFLSLLIVAVVMVPIGVIVVGLYVLVILLLADAGQKWLVAVLAVLSIPLVLLLVAALLFFAAPIMLRAALTRDFSEGFNLAFARDFFRRVGKEAALATAFYLCYQFAVSVLGLLLCCIGSFTGTAAAGLTYFHLLWQLYRIYLSRGGEAIPLASDVTVASLAD